MQDTCGDGEKLAGGSMGSQGGLGPPRVCRGSAAPRGSRVQGLPEGYRGPRGYRTPGFMRGEGTWDPRGDTAGAEGASIDTPPPGTHSVFLVRESQRNPKGFVLSLCHLQRVKHYLILPVSAGGGGPEGAGGAARVCWGFGVLTHVPVPRPGRARRRDGSTSPWTTGRPASPTSSSSWSFTRSTVASCPASCGTTAPAWPSEPSTASTARHGRHGTARYSPAPPARHGSA